MCCIIILSHMEYLGSSPVIGDMYLKHLHNPTLAVDYFFLLSGFGMYLSPRRPERTIRGAFRFAIDKVKKIYPAYIGSLILGSISLFLVTEGIVRVIVKTLLFGLLDLSLFQSIFGMTMFSHSINGVCWFLSTLFVCYLVCPWGLYLIDEEEKHNRLTIILMLTILITVVLSYVASYVEGRVTFIDDLWYGHPIIRCWYLIIGMCIGAFYSTKSSKIGTTQEICTAVIAGGYFLTRNLIHMDQSLLRMIDIFAGILVLYIFSCGKGTLSKFLGSDFMTGLGKVSMYLYLFHYPVRVICYSIYPSLELPGEWGNLIISLSIISITSLMVFIYERIMRKRGRQSVNNS